MAENYLTPGDMATLFKLSKAQWARLRSEGGGPPFIKLGTGRGGSIRYRESAVLEWLAAREMASTSSPAAEIRGRDLAEVAIP